MILDSMQLLREQGFAYNAGTNAVATALEQSVSEQDWK